MEICEEAFCGNPSVSIYLQDRVTAIGERAFADCVNLRSVRIPSSVVMIADNAFEGCSTALIIYGDYGSEAQRFAEKMGFSFMTGDNGGTEFPEI